MGTDTQTPKKKRSSVQQRIEDGIKHAEALRKQELFRKRIELARNGVRSFQSKKHADAVQAFYVYIKILEEWKGCPEGGLSPALFERPKDDPELLLISGVYWDLAKLFDRTEQKIKQKEFHHYLEKFVVFSRGLPHEALSRETLRKYISNDKTLHTAAFQHAYQALGGGKCFIATALAKDLSDETLENLREFRDEVLLKNVFGRVFVFIYERVGPLLAQGVLLLPQGLRKKLSLRLDKFAMFVKKDRDMLIQAQRNNRHY